MTIQKLNPYLNFNGDAEKAIDLYRSALDATVEGDVMRFGDHGGGSPDVAKRVLHAVLRIGSGVIMLSDPPPNVQIPPGGNQHVSLDFDDVQEMERRFHALSVGGKVSMPLQDTFWGARFGMLTDAHGINWIFNATKKPA